MANIVLGSKYKDRITGFAGIAVARTEWINGCARISLQPDALDKDGKPQETQVFDDMQLELVEAKNVVRQTATGGPRPSVKRRPDPKR